MRKLTTNVSDRSSSWAVSDERVRVGEIAELVMSVTLILERNTLFSPIDRWIEVVEPCHTENDIVSREWKCDEIDGVTVGANAERSECEQGRRSVTTTIGEGDDVI